MHKIYSSLKGFSIYNFQNHLVDMNHINYMSYVFDGGFDKEICGYDGNGNGDGDNNNWGHKGTGKGFGFLYGFSSGDGEVDRNNNLISIEESNA
jgi:hypothetical protein